MNHVKQENYNVNGCSSFKMRLSWISLFLQLMKPRIIQLLVITCIGSMLVATKGNLSLISWELAFWTCLGLSISAGGANAINMWYDRDIDAVMQRTKSRPIPAGKLQPNTVLAFGVICGIVSFAMLWQMVNLLTACMAMAGYLFYVLIYTMYLKRRTVHNIVIGGAAGSFPPVVGWAAVQNDVSAWLPWAMFLIIFLWTPPHFWALALKKCGDYTKANIPMLPVVKGSAETKVQMLYYMLVLFPVTLSVGLVGHFGWIYFTSATILGAVWTYKIVRLMYEEKNTRAMDVFFFSLFYLTWLFAAMVVDTFV